MTTGTRWPVSVAQLIRRDYPAGDPSVLAKVISKMVGYTVTTENLRRRASKLGIKRDPDAAAVCSKADRSIPEIRLDKPKMPAPDVWGKGFQDDPRACRPEPRLRLSGRAGGYIPGASSAHTCAVG